MANKTLYNYEKEKTKNEKKKKSNLLKKFKMKKKKEKPSNQIDPDNEIIIGVTVHNEPDKAKVKANKKQSKQKKQKKQKKLKKYNDKEISNKKIKTDKKSKVHIQFKERTNKIIKWTSIIVLLIGMILFAMLSPIFNIKKIKVTGIKKLTEEKVVGLSNLEIGQNIFRINKNEIKKRLKQSGNVDSSEINRKLPNEIEIIVNERVSSFEIEYGNGYAVISSQGYITEITSEDTRLPNLIRDT